MNFLLKKFVTNNFLILSIIALIVIINILFPPKNILSYDVYGYYLYLPMLFVYNNLDFLNLNIVHELNEIYKNTPTLYQLSLIDGNHYIIRYSVGQALMYSPFFFIGHFFAFLLDYPMDGFSKPYQFAIWFGSTITICVGFIFIYKALLKYFEKCVVNIAVIFIFLGSNILMYAGMFGLNAMSHNYLFTLYALLIYVTILHYQCGKPKYWYMAIAISSVMALIRPVEIVSLAVPLLWNASWGGGGDCIHKFWKRIIYSLLVIVTIGSIQILYWKIYCGNFVIDSYNNAGEGLDLLNPHTIDYLFSFRKGWLVYSPIVIICIIGFYFLYRTQPIIFPSLFILFIISIYLASSWTIWWYSASYSSRAAIPMYAILLFPFCSFIQYIFSTAKWLYKYSLILVMSLLLFLNIFQTWQFKEGILDPERMTKLAYLKNFLSTKKHPETEELLLLKRSETENELTPSFDNFSRRIMGFEDMEYGSNPSFAEQPVYAGERSQKVSPSGFSLDLRAPFNALTDKEYAFLRISAYIFIYNSHEEIIKANLCAEMLYKGKTYFWRSLNLENLKLERDKWNYIEFIYLTPEVRTKSDIFKTYFWNRSNSEIFIDNLKMEVLYKE